MQPSPAPRPRNPDLWIGLGLTVAALMLFTLGLGEGALRDWDEGIYALVARETSQASSLRGWLYPTLHGSPFLLKPPLMLWLMAGAYRVGGETEFTTRLPGALLTACSVPLLYGVGRAVFSERLPAALSAAVLLTLLPVVGHGRLAMLDGAVISLFLLLVLCLLRSRRDPRWAVGMGLSMGLIGLTKGIVALLLGGLALIFLILDTPGLLRSPWLWSGLVLGNLPPVVWYGALWQVSDGAVWSVGLVQQSFERIWTTVEGHRGPPWYYAWEVLKSAWPWLLFWPAGLRLALHHRDTGWAKLILVWTIGYTFVISVMVSKLPWYVLPVYPAMALAVGVALTDTWRRAGGTVGRPLLSAQVPLSWRLMLGFLALAGWGAWGYVAFVGSEPTRVLQWTLLGAAFTFSLAAVLLVRRDTRFIWTLLIGSYAVLLLWVATPLWAWRANDEYAVKPVAAMIRQHAPSGQAVYTSHPHGRPSLHFYAARTVFPESASALRARWQEDPAPYLLVDETALAHLGLRDHRVLARAEGWYLITRVR